MFRASLTAPVHRVDDSRQYVLDDDSQPVYGAWLQPNEYSGRMVMRSRTNREGEGVTIPSALGPNRYDTVRQEISQRSIAAIWFDKRINCKSG
jgi:hypothetical protein